VRAAAAAAMAQAEGPEVSACLIEALADADSWVRYFAARSLGRHAAAEGAEALSALALGDKAQHVRIAAVEALGRIGGEAAARAVSRLADSAEPDLARAAARALGMMRGGREM
jgi:hypothetical protein